MAQELEVGCVVWPKHIDSAICSFVGANQNQVSWFHGIPHKPSSSRRQSSTRSHSSVVSAISRMQFRSQSCAQPSSHNSLRRCRLLNVFYWRMRRAFGNSFAVNVTSYATLSRLSKIPVFGMLGANNSNLDLLRQVPLTISGTYESPGKKGAFSVTRQPVVETWPAPPRIIKPPISN